MKINDIWKIICKLEVVKYDKTEGKLEKLLLWNAISLESDCTTELKK